MKCRKNVKSLTTDEKRRLVDAFVALKVQDSVIHPGSQSRYDDFVECHMNAMMAPVGWAHQDSVFFPWHRELLYQFEQLLQSVDPSVPIPYWDWTRHKTGADAGFPFKHDFTGVDGTYVDSDRVKRDPTAPAVNPGTRSGSTSEARFSQRYGRPRPQSHWCDLPPAGAVCIDPGSDWSVDALPDRGQWPENPSDSQRTSRQRLSEHASAEWLHCSAGMTFCPGLSFAACRY